jgi:hypothetical protein
MKNITNGKLTITANLVLEFDFTEAEMDLILAQPLQSQSRAFADLLVTKTPNFEDSPYNLQQFKEGAARCVLEYREQSLKQLPAKSTAANETDVPC